MVLIAAMASWAGVSHAADAAAAADAKGAAANQVEEVVVTAQRRKENLQNVPIAVTAISSTTLQSQGVAGVVNLAVVTPGLNLSRDNAAPQIFLRGVGTTAVGPGQEASDAVYVDGIYIATPASALLPFNNVDQIEVLKGPQGTLFGRNATGGLIQVLTKDPTPTPSMNASIGYGNYQTTEAQFYGTTAISDSVAGNLSLYYKDQVQGWGHNIPTGDDIYNGKTVGLRGKLLVNMPDDTTLKLSADYAVGNDTMAPRQLIPGAVGLDHHTRVGGFYDANGSQDPEFHYTSEGVSADLRHDFGWAKFVSLTGVRYDKVSYALDQDGTPLFFLDAVPINFQTNQFSQELQLQSADSSFVKWIAGLYYLNQTADVGPVRRAGTAEAAFGGFFDTFSTQKLESKAAFVQATVPIGWQTNLTGGFRYTVDDRSITGFNQSATGVVSSPANQSHQWSSPTWRLSLDHRFSDDLMVYASYNRGFKSGIYAPFTPTSTPVNPEKLDAYEIGAKADWFDKRLRLDVSAFHYDYRDIQLTVREAGLSFLVNAAAAKVDGLDAEFTAVPIEGLTLRSGLSLLNGRYTSFPAAPINVPSPASCTPTPHPTGPATGGNTVCSGDASGNKMVQAPPVTLDLGANYKWQTAVGEFVADAGYYYNAGYYFEPDNRIKQGAYGLVNAQLSWAPTQTYRFRVWGRNLTNKQYYAAFSSSLGDFETAAAPRTFGITFEVNY
jgi:iron complex outermembrane receptor protein